ncbi:MAG: hypothetical protein JNK76_00095 [Planctomycetales bacterium]|nr:hypothetical protein [Planctomycetales bacterium]MBN8624702.1 hypothetical protein [Planctomycetota bacterium]
MLEQSPFAQTLGFTRAWFALGVVNADILARHQAEWDRGHDTNAEHYRYRAFSEFLVAHRPLTAEVASALFELGEVDPDRQMGGSIMADIIQLPECPQVVLDAAVATGREHLIRIVERRHDPL